MVGVLYTCGILIHPTFDGNGQTLKCLCLSYIHEHCPKFRNNYFPIKYSEILRNAGAIKDISLWDMRSFQDLAPSTIEHIPENQWVFDYIEELFTIKNDKSGERDDWKAAQKAKNSKLFALAKSVGEKFNIPELTMMKDDNNNIITSPDDIPYNRSIFFDLQENLYNHLVAKGFNKIEVKETLKLPVLRREITTYALQIFLSNDTFPQANEIFRTYILTGTVAISEATHPTIAKYWQISESQFQTAANEMEGILTDDEISSAESIKNQVRLAKKYKAFDNKFEQLKRINFDQYLDVLNHFISFIKAPQSIDDAIEVTSLEIDKLLAFRALKEN